MVTFATLRINTFVLTQAENFWWQKDIWRREPCIQGGVGTKICIVCEYYKIWSNSSHSSRRQKCNSKIFTKCQNQTLNGRNTNIVMMERKTIFSFFLILGSDSAIKLKFIQDAVSSSRYFQHISWFELLWSCELCLLMIFCVSICKAGARAMLCMFSDVPRGRFTTGNLQLFMLRSLGRDNGNIWAVNIQHTLREYPRPPAPAPTCQCVMFY